MGAFSKLFSRLRITSDPNVGTQTSAVIQADSTNSSLVLAPNGSGAIIASIPDGTATGGNARGINAIDLQMIRANANQVAGADYSIVIGSNNRTLSPYAIAMGYGSTATGFFAIAIGQSCTTSDSGAVSIGTSNNAGGEYDTVSGGQSNIANGRWAIIGGGRSNNNGSQYGTISGGQSNTASTNTHATVVGGQGNTSSGAHSVSGGLGNTASGARSISLGGSGSNVASGLRSIVLGGEGSIANGTTSCVINSMYSSASAENSCVINCGSGSQASALNSVVINSGNASSTNSIAFNGSRSEAIFGISFNTYARSMLYNQFTISNGVNVNGGSQSSQLIASKNDTLTTGSATVLSLDGTGTTNLIIPNTSYTLALNRLWNVQIDTIAVVTTITGTATGVSVGDAYRETKQLLFKRVGGTSSIVGTVDTTAIKNDSSLATCALTVTAGASQEMALTFTAPTFAGGGSVTMRVVSKIMLVEVAY